MRSHHLVTVWGLILMPTTSFKIPLLMSMSRDHRSYNAPTGSPSSQSQPFQTLSSSGSTLSEAFVDLRDVLSSIHRPSMSPYSLGLLFYSGEPSETTTAHDIREELAELHRECPVDHIIASPVMATSSSDFSHNPDMPEEEGWHPQQESLDDDRPAFFVTLSLVSLHGAKVFPFTTSPTSELRDHLPNVQVSSAAASLRQALGNFHCSLSAVGPPLPRGCYKALCLAFGAEDGGGETCMSQLHHLNTVLRKARPSGSCGRSIPCPVVASITPGKQGAVDGGVLLSTLDDSGPTVVGSAVVGAMIAAKDTSATAFHLVHASDHMPLRGSQARIKRMQGGSIAEVVPVPQSVLQHFPVGVAGVGAASCTGGGGGITAAAWCQAALNSSSTFEKIAMQRALGVGMLSRLGDADGIGDSSGGGGSGGGFSRLTAEEELRPLGGASPCLPAVACMAITEVDSEGQLHLARDASEASSPGSSVKSDDINDGSTPSSTSSPAQDCLHGSPPLPSSLPPPLRTGDLCDLRAVGPLAAIQAERDAYTWFRVARLSASLLPPPLLQEGRAELGHQEDCRGLEQGHGQGDPAGDDLGWLGAVGDIQGCLATSAAGRFGWRPDTAALAGAAAEACKGIAHKAAGEGHCPAAGVVVGRQVVSLDNVGLEVAARAGSCLANVFFCGRRPLAAGGPGPGMS